LFKKSFYGGRNEIFGNPNKNDYIYYYDFESMYGTIMKNENFAYGDYEILTYPKYFNNINNSGDINLNKEFLDEKKNKENILLFNDINFYKPGFYEIKFTSELDLPILPFKTIEHGLIFPNGTLLSGMY
jgi:hypothetical protein